MLVACWSVKGGSGTTVVSAVLAALLACRSPQGALAADLAGDLPAVFGLEGGAAGPGLLDWMAAGPGVPDGALDRLEVDVGSGLRLLPRGTGAAGAGRAEALAAELAARPFPVVVDCGSGGDAAGLAVAAASSLSLLVLRPCYLALRRALDAPLRPSGVVLVCEQGRALGRRDVEDVLDAPVRAEVPVSAAVARTVDAGLVVHRVPRALQRALAPLVAA
jgi:hypothetical protein